MSTSHDPARPDTNSAPASAAGGDPDATQVHGTVPPTASSGPYGVVWPAGQSAPATPAASAGGSTAVAVQPSPAAPPPADPWTQGGDPWIDVTPQAPDAPPPGVTGGRRVVGAVALVAAGALIGALAVGAISGRSSDTTALTSQNGQVQGPGGLTQPGQGQQGVPGQGQQGQQGVPGQGQQGQQGVPGQGQQGQQGAGPNGQGSAPGGGQGFGRDGEQRVLGTVASVSGSALTIRSGTASARYTITSDTQVVRDGAPAAASDLRAGDQVLVHVLPQASGDGVLERVIARSASAPASGPGDDGSTT